MIKGILLKRKPWMAGVTIEKIFEDIDYFKGAVNQEVTDSKGYVMNLEQYSGSKYKVKVYESENTTGIDAIYKMYCIISSSLPEFICCFKINSNKLLMAYSNFKSIDENQEQIMDLFIEELIRVCVVVIKEFGEDNVLDIDKFIKDYIDTCTYCSELD